MSGSTQADIEAAQKELVERIKKFNEGLLPLLGKYKLGLGAQAFLMPNGCISAKPVLVDELSAVKPEEKKEGSIEGAEG